MKYTLGFRIWHWLSAIVILGLLGTVFLRKTFLSYRTNSEIIMTKLTDMGADIFKEDAVIIAKAIRNIMWEWHLILGYALAFLVLYRVVLFFIDRSKRDAFSSLTLHKKGVKISYYIVYATIFFITISGFVVYLHEYLELSQETTKQIKSLHELSYNVFLVFVPLHILGVFIADAKDEHGIVSTMINGKTKDNF
ncbi:MAG: cytochrome B [Sulfurimonas sp. RIFOXYD12_FULL_33_39]|uniref:cytochrome b/b6 domain-containing protein n=1 Tax=unclassified Sulfurimonas TaxID=2623549 RepID=UPI0008C2C33E|nr:MULTISPECIES: cytochrome b/b6 domain-containing protein [unclassified Sulfurimonas]OHE05808.1 MAG: cytochrome B [Sulfurimonas sp. RIFCSPLOWO2_12_FULL_34_6]OHE09693.1 MAG: cytochrome B [Sulfurimonas sp. RIFOXYD12_FULL_33_39]OHE13799.1 MAG: cytochrome B [Sulfurimonas sp. RIFOXYD2_FULL_34_21]DAB28849.1 MAG TPA: cytochrome B [Sulfurimonas sp. UBA10385]